MASLIGKGRKPKFELHLKIYDLNNVPLVSGVSLIKWNIPGSIHSEHRGRTQKCPIANHRVEYSYQKLVHVRIGVDRNGVLAECPLEFEVLQEFSAANPGAAGGGGGGGGRDEKITLGVIRLNLSEYVEESDVVVREAAGPQTAIRTSFASPTTGLAALANDAKKQQQQQPPPPPPSQPGSSQLSSSASSFHSRQRSVASGMSDGPLTMGSSSISPRSSLDTGSRTKASTGSSPPMAPSLPAGATTTIITAGRPGDVVEDGVVRRYLMESSKINSTLKISILMVQVDGERNFVAPALKTAPVFGGIAGIVAGEGPGPQQLQQQQQQQQQQQKKGLQSVLEGDGDLPGLTRFGTGLDASLGGASSSTASAGGGSAGGAAAAAAGSAAAGIFAGATSLTGKTRDASDIQDMYRQALAASWMSPSSELPADECIEDIFAGGDGFGPNGPPPPVLPSSSPYSSLVSKHHHHRPQQDRSHGHSPSGFSLRRHHPHERSSSGSMHGAGRRGNMEFFGIDDEDNSNDRSGRGGGRSSPRRHLPRRSPSQRPSSDSDADNSGGVDPVALNLVPSGSNSHIPSISTTPVQQQQQQQQEQEKSAQDTSASSSPTNPTGGDLQSDNNALKVASSKGGPSPVRPPRIRTHSRHTSDELSSIGSGTVIGRSPHQPPAHMVHHHMASPLAHLHRQQQQQEDGGGGGSISSILHSYRNYPPPPLLQYHYHHHHHPDGSTSTINLGSFSSADDYHYYNSSHYDDADFSFGGGGGGANRHRSASMASSLATTVGSGTVTSGSSGNSGGGGGSVGGGGMRREHQRRGRGSGFKRAREVDEFEMRDDLVAWELPALGV